MDTARSPSGLNSRHIVKGTRDNYVSTLNLYWMPYLGLRRIDMITPTMLRGVISQIQWTSAGVKRNAIIKLASISKAAVLDGLITKNPTASLDKPTAVKKVVEPYTRAEAEAIIFMLRAKSTLKSRPPSSSSASSPACDLARQWACNGRTSISRSAQQQSSAS